MKGTTRSDRWAGKAAVGPFLTDIDPQAAVKGSRDPLGIQTIWSRLGRHVVGNLTTVTTSARDFTTLLLGYHFAERAADQGQGDGDLNVFLRWEQLAAHARFRVNGDERIRGIERVKRAKAEGGKIRIGVDPAGPILSNQRTYGLWGLYTASARASGLVEGEPTRLAAAGRDLVEGTYLSAFTAAGRPNADPVLPVVTKDGWIRGPEENPATLLSAVGRVLGPRLRAAEKRALRPHLLLGLGAPQDPTGGRQAVLAGAVDETLSDRSWSLAPDSVRGLAESCRRREDPGPAAADCLDRIVAAERVLAPAAVLFDFILGCDGQSAPELAAAVRSAWGSRVGTVDPGSFAQVEGEMGYGPEAAEVAGRWIRLAKALASGGYQDAIGLLLEQNAFVMRARAAAGPWVDLSEGRIRVRYRDDRTGELGDQAALVTLWRHPYFLDAMRFIASDLRL